MWRAERRWSLEGQVEGWGVEVPEREDAEKADRGSGLRSDSPR
jgi:hypothetical protein